MDGFSLTYWVACHTVGFTAVFVSATRARRTGDRCEKAFSLLMLTFSSIVVVTLTAFLFGRSADLVRPAEMNPFTVASVLGLLALLYMLPRYTNISCGVPWAGAFDRIARPAVWILSVLFVLLLPAGFLDGMITVLFVFLSAVILYVDIVQVLFRGGKLGRPTAAAGWVRLNSTVGIISVILFPAFLTIDFFRFPVLSALLPEGFRIFPGFYAAWNAAYLFQTLRPDDREKAHDHPAGGTPPSSCADAHPAFGLTERELAVARLLCGGYRYRQIADELFISFSTVKTHVYNIYRKTETNDKLGLIRKLSGSTEKPSKTPKNHPFS